MATAAVAECLCEGKARTGRVQCPTRAQWRPSAERNSSMRQHQHQREPVRETELRQLSDLLPSSHLSCTTCVTTPTRFSSFLYQRLALARVNPAGMRRGVSV